jgi:hypothetical protein
MPLPTPTLLQTAATTSGAIAAVGAAATVAAVLAGKTARGQKRRETQTLTPEQISAGEQISQRLASMDVGESTRTPYSNKIISFANWCETNYPGALLPTEEVQTLVADAVQQGDHKDYLPIYRFNTQYLEETYYAAFEKYMTTYLDASTGMLYGFQTYNSMKCAFKKIWEWRPKTCLLTRGVCPASFNTALDPVIKRIKDMNNADLKNGTRIDIDHSQEGLTFEQYREICLFFLKKNSIQAWFFLVMEFNLMCRINQVVALTTSRITWVGDALAILFTKKKVTQKGSFEHHKHLFANPYDPIVCPITALGVYLLVQGPTLEGVQLFKNYDDKAFNSALKNACIALGFPHDLTGSHALRKSSWSYSQNGTTCSPSYAATCLRADHSLGTVKDRYNFGGAGQDQYFGRILAGLDPCTLEFAALPPHFKPSLATRSLIREIFPSYGNWGERFFPVIGHALASVVHHQDILRMYDTQLLNTILFTSATKMDALQKCLFSLSPVYTSPYVHEQVCHRTRAY